MRSELTVFHTLHSLHSRAGGPPRSVSALANALAVQPGLSVYLISQLMDGEDEHCTPDMRFDKIALRAKQRLSFITSIPFARGLTQAESIAIPSLIHDHGVWTATNYRAYAYARKRGIPYVVQPRGMLEAWSLQHKRIKKDLALWAYQRRSLRHASLFVATSEGEAESIRRLGLTQPIALIPNGVGAVGGVTTVERSISDDAERRVVLFLSRIHPKKGLLELMRAWSRARLSGWELRVAGPDEGGHLSAVVRLARELDIESTVKFLGPVEGDEKEAAYQAADVFVLPTFSENFGLVVVEALARGIPVITTKGAPWADLESYRCGWWIETGVDPLQAALVQAMTLSDSERRAMGERARACARRYDWQAIARDTAGVYRWILAMDREQPSVLWSH